MKHPVTIELDERTWGALASKADRRGVRIPDVVAAILTTVQEQPPAPSTRVGKQRIVAGSRDEDQIMELLRLGRSRDEAARELGVGIAAVYAAIDRARTRAAHHLAVIDDALTRRKSHR